jgi:hypothetical protein
MGIGRRTAALWGTAGFTAASMIAPRLQPGYRHRSHHISGLAAKGQRSAIVMVPGFIALGSSQLLAPMPSRALTALSRLAGVTTLIAGVVPVSHPRCPQPGSDPEANRLDGGHMAASVATFALWTALPLIASKQNGPVWFRQASRLLGGASAVGLVGAAVTSRTESPVRGAVQRAFLATVFAWQLLAAAVRSEAQPSSVLRMATPKMASASCDQ